MLSHASNVSYRFRVDVSEAALAEGVAAYGVLLVMAELER